MSGDIFLWHFLDLHVTEYSVNLEKIKTGWLKKNFEILHHAIWGHDIRNADRNSRCFEPNHKWSACQISSTWLFFIYLTVQPPCMWHLWQSCSFKKRHKYHLQSGSRKWGQFIFRPSLWTKSEIRATRTAIRREKAYKYICLCVNMVRLDRLCGDMLVEFILSRRHDTITQIICGVNRGCLKKPQAFLEGIKEAGRLRLK